MQSQDEQHGYEARLISSEEESMASLPLETSQHLMHNFDSVVDDNSEQEYNYELVFSRQ